MKRIKVYSMYGLLILLMGFVVLQALMADACGSYLNGRILGVISDPVRCLPNRSWLGLY